MAEFLRCIAAVATATAILGAGVQAAAGQDAQQATVVGSVVAESGAEVQAIEIEIPGEHPAYHLMPEPYSDGDRQMVTLDDLLEMAIQYNLGIQRQNISIEKSHFSVDKTYYSFDPTVSSSLNYSRSARGGAAAAAGGGVSGSESYRFNAGVNKAREFGDSFGFDYSLSRSSYNLVGGGEDTDIPVTYDASFSLSYNRPLGRGAGKFINLIPRYVASNNTQLAYDQLDDQLRNLKKNVIDTYYQAVSARETITVREKSLKRSLEQLVRQIERYKAGLAIKADVLQAENSVLSQRTQLLSAYSNYDNLLDSLTNLVGLPVEFSLTVDEEGGMLVMVDDIPDELWGLVEQNSFELKSLNNQLANLRMTREQQANQLKPNLNLNFSYGRSGEDDTITSSVTGYENENYSVGLNWQATPGERNSKASLAQTDLDLASLELSIQEAELQLKTTLRNMQRDLSNKRQAVALAEDSLKVVNETYEITSARNDVGLATTLDVVEAQESLLQAELSLLNAKIAYQEAYRGLLLLAGLI